MSIILGINTHHNGSVALICDGKVKSAIQAERISRVKRQPLPLERDIKLTAKCVHYCLDAADFEYSDIEAIALCTPQKLTKINDLDLFRYIGGIPKKYAETFYVPHHFSHMEYIAHYGNLEPGIILIIDGSGSLEEDRLFFNVREKYHSKVIDYIQFGGKEVISAYWFDGLTSSLIYRFSPSHHPNDEINKGTDLLQSIGQYWEWASLYCCGSRNDAGKVMGLAAFGDVDQMSEKTSLSITDKCELNLNFIELKKNFKDPNILSLDLSNSKHHQNLALKVQSETEDVILKLLGILKEKYPTDTLYYCGGVALNVVANERIKSSNLFKNVVLNGSVEDNGTAIGAGLAASIQLGYKRKSSVITDYYGRKYSHEEIMEAVAEYNFSHKVLSDKELFEHAADLIKKEKIFGWFQGGSEFGPRALGNRSILANPSSPTTKHILDHYMKCRDRYRPYAPVVIEEKANQYFDINTSSPVMMRNVKVLDKGLVAITHFDETARIQTVNKKDNEILYLLLLEVEKKTGYPILLNTSFNLPGEPIVESPHDALSSFSRGALDNLFLGNVLISR
ncbi:carbamoyltransferase C-terminal domain-containing protein [Candidatus Pelagibacter sp. Uisw_101]|uniref:carbamoyltransferase C-terminal domain-containing protein n=1 Tax=Candidatus Pelagibacter sp. Uisw_101 TaxID=3230982 RepID=UPI0039ED6D02